MGVEREALTGRLQRSWMPEPRWEWRVILIKLIPCKPQNDVIQCLLIRDSCRGAKTNSHSVVNANMNLLPLSFHSFFLPATLFHRTDSHNMRERSFSCTRMTNKRITFVTLSAHSASDEMPLDSPPCRKTPSSCPSLSHKAQFFRVGVFQRDAFRPVSSLMGITHKPLSFRTALWPETVNAACD